MSKTVLERLLDDCEQAYRSKYPIIFIQTEEQEMIQRVVASNRLVVRLKLHIEEDIHDKHYILCSEGETVYVRHPPATTSDGCVNVYAHQELFSRSREIPENFQMPQMSIYHVGENPSSFERIAPMIMAFVDRYLCSSDDNSALRNSLYLLYGNPVSLPSEIRTYCAMIDVVLPALDELCMLVRAATDSHGLRELPEQTVYDIAYQLSGFTVVQAEQILKAIISMPDVGGENAIYDAEQVSEQIDARKRQFLKQTDLLTLISISEDDAEIGGMKQFKDWFNDQVPCILNAGRMEMEIGVSAPRGVLMCGVPGCGKSLAARAAARQLGKPLLQMDIGNLMNKYVGESERKMDLALKLAEAMSPCVLWIDELDKGFSEAGNTGNTGNSGVFRRMFGKLLTWMQECKKPCFIFATANDITSLPKEFFRSGRFDELFSVYMPMHKECVEILKNQMQRLCRRAKRELFTKECWQEKNLDGIINQFIYSESKTIKQRFVTGADIEKLVNIAIRAIWRGGIQSNQISNEQWSNEILRALKSSTVHGDGPDNLDAITMCYIRLLRNNFRSVSAESLFTAADYLVETQSDGEKLTGGFREKSKEERNKLHPYDRALYDMLCNRANALVPSFEHSARRQLIR